MMLNDASGSGPYNGMMAGHMTDHAADGGALQTTLGTSHGRQQRETGGNNKRNSELAHFSLLKAVLVA
jgi:hypothetical protein